MPNPVAPQAPVMTWRKLRQAVAAVVKGGAPNARVHDRWKLKFSEDGKVDAAILKPNTGPSAGKIHSWMVGVSAAEVLKNANGDPEFIGGGRFDWSVTLAVWGFLDYTLGTEAASSDDAAEAEAEAVAAWIAANSSGQNPGLAMDDPTGLRRVGVLEFSSIDVHPFGGGSNAHVAQGSLVCVVTRLY